jgi:hypothetical protein
MIRYKKSQITIPLEIKVEVLMIALFSLFCILFIGSILQNNQLTHNYFRKDVSLVKNSLLLLPYDMDFVYLDHTIKDGKGKLDRIGFEIDRYYTSTISEVNSQSRADGIKRSYINFYNENFISEGSVLLQSKQRLSFSKNDGKLFVGKSLEEQNKCLGEFDYNTKSIYLNTSKEVYDLIIKLNPAGINFFKYNPSSSILRNSVLIEVLVDSTNNLKTTEVYTSKSRSLGCLLSNDLISEIYYIDDYIIRNFGSDVEYIKIKINQEKINDLRTSLGNNLK